MGMMGKTFRVLGRAAGRVIDIRVDKWIGFDYLREITTKTVDVIKDSYTVKEASFQETFQEALERLNLTEEDLQARLREFSRLCWFHLGITFLVICYGLYMAFNNNLIAMSVTFCLSFWCAGQAFKYHFWMFQIQNRKLGCTISEWFNSEIKSGD